MHQQGKCGICRDGGTTAVLSQAEVGPDSAGPSKNRGSPHLDLDSERGGVRVRPG